MSSNDRPLRFFLSGIDESFVSNAQAVNAEAVFSVFANGSIGPRAEIEVVEAKAYDSLLLEVRLLKKRIELMQFQNQKTRSNENEIR